MVAIVGIEYQIHPRPISALGGPPRGGVADCWGKVEVEPPSRLLDDLALLTSLSQRHRGRRYEVSQLRIIGKPIPVGSPCHHFSEA
jgi:hypothetical protein